MLKKGVLLMVVITAGSLFSQSENKFNQIYTAFNNKDYEAVIKTNNENKQRVTGEQQFKINLMIAKACCETSKWQLGQDMYDYLLKYYSKYLAQKNINSIKSYQNKCRQHVNQNSFENLSSNEMKLFASIISKDATNNVRVQGKEGAFSVNRALRSANAVNFSKTKSPKKFLLDEENKAMDYYKKQHNNSNVLYTKSKYFLIASYFKMTQSKLDKLALELDDFYDFIIDTYRLEKIPYRIAVNIAESKTRMTQIAELLYGNKDIGNAMGLSMMESYSMMCMIPKDPYRYRGTIRHELTHLLLNYNHPQLPGWISEGIPSLYEATDVSQKKGIDNWRGQTVKKLKNTNYGYSYWDNGDLKHKEFNFKSFLNYNWNQFEGKTKMDNKLVFNDLEKSLNYAIARYFIFYLQDTNQLQNVFNKAIKLNTNINYQENLSEFILQTITWQNFNNWLDQKLPLNIYEKAQLILKEAGFYNGEIDGAIGTGSKRALREYQIKNGLTDTGELDDKTLAFMGLIRDTGN